MHLIHVRLRMPPGTVPPDDVRALLLDHIRPGGAVDHVSIARTSTVQDPLTVGLFVTAPSPAEAQALALSAVVRALTPHSPLPRLAILDFRPVRLGRVF